MKQGQARHTRSGTKREPIAKKVVVGAVSEMGTSGNRVTSRMLYSGKGVQAPSHTRVIHPRGSQRG